MPIDFAYKRKETLLGIKQIIFNIEAIGGSAQLLQKHVCTHAFINSMHQFDRLHKAITARRIIFLFSCFELVAGLSF